MTDYLTKAEEALSRGDLARARDCLTRFSSRSIAPQLTNKGLRACLAEVELAALSGEAISPIERLQDLLSQVDSSGSIDRALLGRGWYRIAEIALLSEDVRLAKIALKNARAEYSRVNDRDGVILCRALQVRLHTETGDFVKAGRVLARAVPWCLDPATHPSTRLRLRLAESEYGLRRGDPAGARAAAREAVGLSLLIDDQVLQSKAYFALATAAGMFLEEQPLVRGRHEAVWASLEGLRRRDRLLEGLDSTTAFRFNMQQTREFEQAAWLIAHAASDGQAALEISERGRATPSHRAGDVDRLIPPTDTHLLEYTVWPSATSTEQETLHLGIVWLAPGHAPRTYYRPLSPKIVQVLKQLSELGPRDPWEVALKAEDGRELRKALGWLLLPEPLREELAASTDTMHLLIIPTDFLWALPWPSIEATADRRHLVEVAEISVLPSLRFASQTHLDQPMSRPLLMLDFGIDGQEIELYALSLLASASMTAANREEFLAGLMAASVAVVSSHGYAPGLSSNCVMLPSDELLTGDHLRAAAGMPEVLVFGSCYSGRVLFERGEDPSGFVTDGLQGGARAVIGGIWALPTGAVARVLADMYIGLSIGCTPQAALRRAQLVAISDGLELLEWAGLLAFSCCGPSEVDAGLSAQVNWGSDRMAMYHALRASQQLTVAIGLCEEILQDTLRGLRSVEDSSLNSDRDVDRHSRIAERDLTRAHELVGSSEMPKPPDLADVMTGVLAQEGALKRLRRLDADLGNAPMELAASWTEVDAALSKAANGRGLVLAAADPSGHERTRWLWRQQLR